MKKTAAVVALSAIGLGLGALPSFATVSTNNDADLSGTAAFIRNSWVQGGLKENGTFGTEQAVPANYNSLFSSENGGLGLIDDATENGFDMNDNGDFFMPGQPYEAWGIKVDGNPSLVNTDEDTGIPGSWTASETVGDASVTWESTSTVNGIDITQVISAPAVGSHLLRVTVTLQNTDSSAHTVYYSRQVDPDNNVDKGGEYETFNRVIAQSSTSQIVMGTSYDPAFSSIGYRATDPDAVVRISDWSWPLNVATKAEMDAALVEMRTDYKVGFQDYLDSTIDIAFRKDIGAGQSAVVAFDYILNPAEVGVPALALDLSLDLAVGDAYAGTSTGLSGGGLAPNSTYTLTEFSVPHVLFTGTTLPNGNFFDTTALPADCRPGSHTLVLAGTSPAGAQVSDLVTYTLDANCIVTAFDPYAAANGAPNPQAELAETGFDASPLLVGSALVVAAGAAGLTVVRRRKA